MPNLTSVTVFLLVELSDIRELQILHAFGFLALYLTTIAGNLLIITAVIFDHHLHSPMYFFLMNLAMLDIGSASVVLPKSIANSFMKRRSISYSGCVAQVFLLFFFGGSDFAILTIMAQDRYVAICNPLRYETIMHKEACIRMVAIVWMFSLLYATMHTAGTFAITFCSNVVHQFFCEIPQLLKLSCSELYLVEIGLIAFGACLALGCFIFIIITYIYIFATVLRIPSERGQKKTLSTCLPHLTVVSMLIFTGIFAFVKPNNASDLDVVLSIIYAVIPPLLNPFIYSMRNKEIQTALWKLLDVVHTSKTLSKRVIL